jgi:hypothetical protein
MDGTIIYQYVAIPIPHDFKIDNLLSEQAL